MTHGLSFIRTLEVKMQLKMSFRNLQKLLFQVVFDIFLMIAWVYPLFWAREHMKLMTPLKTLLSYEYI